jgi:hypothetical protein
MKRNVWLRTIWRTSSCSSTFEAILHFSFLSLSPSDGYQRYDNATKPSPDNTARAGPDQIAGSSGILLWCLDSGEDSISSLSRIGWTYRPASYRLCRCLQYCAIKDFLVWGRRSHSDRNVSSSRALDDTETPILSLCFNMIAIIMLTRVRKL